MAETVAQRAGGLRAGRAFAAQVDADAFAPRVNAPLLVVAAGADPLVGVDESLRLADAAPFGESLVVADGDHLCANRRWVWLPQAADWLVARLR